MVTVLLLTVVDEHCRTEENHYVETDNSESSCKKNIQPSFGVSGERCHAALLRRRNDVTRAHRVANVRGVRPVKVAATVKLTYWLVSDIFCGREAHLLLQHTLHIRGLFAPHFLQICSSRKGLHPLVQSQTESENQANNN